MDFVEGLPSFHDKSIIMVVVDRLSKYTHFVPISHPFTTSTVAYAFLQHMIRLHGMPTSIVSDYDKIFTSQIWKTLFQLQGTQLCMSSSYHSQIDSQTEVVNHTLKQYLRCFTSDQSKRWLDWLIWSEFSYNTLVHTATKMSPFEAVYGRPPPNLLSYVSGTTKVQVVDECLRNHETILKELHHNFLVA